MPESSEVWPAIALLGIQAVLLGLFSFFAFFNYLYGFASLWKPKIPRTQPSGKKVAVVIVAFNEKYVLENTVRACDALSYPNKLTVLADDSTDPEVAESLRELARKRGCRQVLNHPFYQVIGEHGTDQRRDPIEIWESADFVLFHRPVNSGFKGGSVQKVQEYLDSRDIEFMYLLDADWHPQEDAIEKTMAILEARDNTAFVQTRRISFPIGMNLFQKYVALIEESCYYVDFRGRQVLGHPTLFSGCCTLFRLSAVRESGGFTPGHLTEDLDLSDRLWLNGWLGVYEGDIVNYGEVPFTYDHYRRQQERWAAGSARAFRNFLWPILTTDQFGWFQKLSALRQNGYFTTTLLTGLAILVGMLTVSWLAMYWNSYSVEYYLYTMGTIKVPFVTLLYLCVLSNFIEPLIMIVVMKKSYRDLIHMPMMVWHAWSVLHTYIYGNIKGLFGIKLGWFLTPKFDRSQVGRLSRIPPSVRILNIGTCIAFFCLYIGEGWMFGWFDEFALLLVPAFLLASVK
ncbi:MAG: glycosyltransferase family 2 protein [Gammaproteobacteria bacterium]|nr:glycosyltransferase family 2 protein [Gammaproteobacteria bacterium]